MDSEASCHCCYDWPNFAETGSRWLGSMRFFEYFQVRKGLDLTIHYRFWYWSDRTILFKFQQWKHVTHTSRSNAPATERASPSSIYATVLLIVPTAMTKISASARPVKHSNYHNATFIWRSGSSPLTSIYNFFARSYWNNWLGSLVFFF